MWYFSWILGIGVALSFGIINVMWLESRRFDETGAPHQSPAPRR
jgi:cyd operon protein YbgT